MEESAKSLHWSNGWSAILSAIKQMRWKISRSFSTRSTFFPKSELLFLSKSSCHKCFLHHSHDNEVIILKKLTRIGKTKQVIKCILSVHAPPAWFLLPGATISHSAPVTFSFSSLSLVLKIRTFTLLLLNIIILAVWLLLLKKKKKWTFSTPTQYRHSKQRGNILLGN